MALYSCNDNANKLAVENAGKYLVDSIALDNADLGINPVSGTNLCYNTTGQAPIIWYFSQNRKIYGYNIAQKSIADSINIARDSDIVFYHANYYIDSAKKVYLLYHGEMIHHPLNPLEKTNSILVLDGTKRYSINYHDNDSPKNFLYDAYEPLKIGNNILLCKQPYYRVYRDSERVAYYSRKILSIFTIKDTSLVEKRNFAPFPEEFRTKYYYSDRPVSCMVNDSLVYYCFPTSNTLYKYHINSNQTEEIKLKNVSENNLRPYDLDSITDMEYDVKYAITTDNYISLSYDQSSAHFLLLQTLAVDYNKPDSAGHILQYKDKPVIAYVLDSAFNCIKKVKFDHQIYCTTTLFYQNRFYVPSIKHHQLKIYVYEL